MTPSIVETVQDVRVTLRAWRRAPGFVLTAVVTLALGTGAVTAIFTVLSGVLIRPLPLPDADRLVQLSVSSPADPRYPPTYVTADDLSSWRAGARTLELAATYSPFSQNLEVAVPERLATVRADGWFFATLGVAALHGRTFHERDPPDVVVASFGFWQRHFGGDASAIGRSLTLDGRTFTLVGVMPKDFQVPYRNTETDLWTPWVPRTDPGSRLDAVIGRLRADATLDAARQELGALSAGLAAGRRANVVPLSEVVGRPVRTPLFVLMGAVVLVLFGACANVANLLLARAAARRREMAVRTVLGAGRWRLMRQCVTESLLLSSAGGLVGLIVGAAAIRLLVNLAGSQIPRAADIGLDWRVFAFLAAVCLLTGVAFGIVPALGTAAGDVQQDLKSGERGSRSHGRVRDALVVAEVALALMLLIGAGLLLRTFAHLVSTSPGFDPSHVLTVHVAVADADESRQLVSRVAAIPGVDAAGFISLLPLQHANWSGRFAIAGGTGDGSAEFRYVTPGYFQAMGIPIRLGRGLTDGDTADRPRVLLINEALARRYFPTEDPVGRVLTDRGTIVGVVGDVRQSRLDRPADPEIYYPVAQNFAQIGSVGSTLVVRSALQAQSLVAAIRGAVREVRPGQAIFRVETLEDVVRRSIGSHRLYLWLLGVFAAIGTLLAATGIYGVMAYLVTLRTREFGIRMALGADQGRVVRLVVGRGGALLGVGVAIGAGGALALGRFLRTLVHGVATTDLVTFGAAAAALAAVGLGACLLPAWRASRVDPAIALRAD